MDQSAPPPYDGQLHRRRSAPGRIPTPDGALLTHKPLRPPSPGTPLPKARREWVMPSRRPKTYSCWRRPQEEEEDYDPHGDDNEHIQHIVSCPPTRHHSVIKPKPQTTTTIPAPAPASMQVQTSPTVGLDQIQPSPTTSQHQGQRQIPRQGHHQSHTRTAMSLQAPIPSGQDHQTSIHTSQFNTRPEIVSSGHQTVPEHVSPLGLNPFRSHQDLEAARTLLNFQGDGTSSHQPIDLTFSPRPRPLPQPELVERTELNQNHNGIVLSEIDFKLLESTASKHQKTPSNGKSNDGQQRPEADGVEVGAEARRLGEDQRVETRWWQVRIPPENDNGDTDQEGLSSPGYSSSSIASLASIGPTPELRAVGLDEADDDDDDVGELSLDEKLTVDRGKKYQMNAHFKRKLS